MPELPEVETIKNDLAPYIVGRNQIATWGRPGRSKVEEIGMAVTDIIQQCRKSLASYYGPQLRGVILYGSVARNQASPASDVDLLVLLNPPFDYFVELRRIVELLYPIQLESDRLISAQPVPYDEFEQGSLQLYRNAKREGVPV